jgi:hypothetical protein
MSFAPSEVILGATLPLENGSTITFSVAGHIETERDIDDAVVIFGRKLLKYTNSASDADRLTVRQVVASITSTPLDKVPDVGTPTPPAPVKEPAKVAPPVAAPAPVMGPAPTVAEQAAAAVAQCIKPPATTPKEPAPSAPPTPEASAPAAAVTAPPEGFSLCVECGEAVPANQAKLSQLFMSKTLCKKCMDSPRGSE